MRHVTTGRSPTQCHHHRHHSITSLLHAHDHSTVIVLIRRMRAVGQCWACSRRTQQKQALEREGRGSALRRNEQHLCLAPAYALAWASSSAMKPSWRSAALDPPLALWSLWSRPDAGWAATTRCIGFLRMSAHACIEQEVAASPMPSRALVPRPLLLQSVRSPLETRRKQHGQLEGKKAERLCGQCHIVSHYSIQLRLLARMLRTGRCTDCPAPHTPVGRLAGWLA